MIRPGRISSRWLAVLAATVLVAGGCAAPATVTGTSTEPDDAPSAAPVPVVVPKLEPCSTLTRVSPPAASGEWLLDVDLPCLIPGPAINPVEMGGRPVVVNLWATWCQPCREEMPILQAAHKRFADRVQFVGVNTKDRPEWAGDFLQQVKVTYPEVVDADGQLLASLRSPGLPVTVVLDRAGRISGRQIGRISDQRLTQLLTEVTG